MRWWWWGALVVVVLFVLQLLGLATVTLEVRGLGG